MNIQHLFHYIRDEDDYGKAFTVYTSEVRDNCSWVPSGHGVACRLYGDEEMAPLVLVANGVLQIDRPTRYLGLTPGEDGLYQLVSDSGPRLVRMESGTVTATWMLRWKGHFCEEVRHLLISADAWGVLWYHEDDEHKPWEQRRVCRVERRLFR